MIGPFLFSSFAAMDYTLEKSNWTDADFDQLRWQDVTIYQMALNGDLEMDIDYIFQRNEPEVKGLIPTYCVAPCTLVFKQISDLKFDMDVIRHDAFKIDYIERGPYWTIVTKNGEMHFSSDEFEMFVRQQPTLQYKSAIGLERGGYSLERTTTQQNDYLQHEEYLHRRKKEAELYEFAKKRCQKQVELEQLNEKRENGEIDVQVFLLLRKELMLAIDGYAYWLKGTMFEDYR